MQGVERTLWQGICCTQLPELRQKLTVLSMLEALSESLSQHLCLVWQPLQLIVRIASSASSHSGAVLDSSPSSLQLS